MATERVGTIIIGGGHAGLAVSHHLRRRGLEHVILERGRVGERWRSERWDSLAFQFPNWMMALPGFPYSGPEPDAFAPCIEVIRFIEDYARHIAAPLRTGVTVTALRPASGAARFALTTDESAIEAWNVVVATGPFQRPRLPKGANALTGILQLHSSAYRNPDQLPPGAVLVAGAGGSGSQIAEELLAAGRRVYLAVGAHRRAPRRYRGRDFGWWEFALGHWDLIERPARRVPPVVTGAGGGHDIDLRQFARQGITLVGHLTGAMNGKVGFAPDLDAQLNAADQLYFGYLRRADEYVARNGLNFPEALPSEPLPHAAAQEPILELDLKAAGIGSIVWASGFDYDFGWIDFPVFSTAGEPPTLEPMHRRGVTTVPGLYFMGLQWHFKNKSTTLIGCDEDAAHLAAHIAAQGS